MLSFDDMKRMTQNKGTIGQQLKRMSDDIMQQTFDNNIPTRMAYLYDYYHDDNAEEEYGYDPSKSPNKIPVKVKFIIKEYKSASKDDPEYHIMFEPDEWNNQSMKPDWFENYSRLGIKFPIGLYADIPNDRGIYERFLIFYSENANQFPKFGVMKCNYRFHWITTDGANRYKRKMWGVQRTQNSYNAGIYTWDKTTRVENQSKFWLPWNYISAEIFYNQRIIISMPMKEPITYQISKIENTVPKGINLVTVYQDIFDQTKDYVNLETGEMYADYYQSDTPPEIEDVDKNNKLVLSASTNQIKVGGSYKIITACILNTNKEDITGAYNLFKWDIYLNDELIDSDLITTKDDLDSLNKYKIKFLGNDKYIGSILKVVCHADDLFDELSFDIIAL